MYLDLLNNIITGINELYVCKYLLDLDLTLMNIWRDNYCSENDYDSTTKLSIIFSILHEWRKGSQKYKIKAIMNDIVNDKKGHNIVNDSFTERPDDFFVEVCT